MKALRLGGLRATKTEGCHSRSHKRLGPPVLLGEGWVPSLLYLLEKYRLVFLFSTCVRGMLSSRNVSEVKCFLACEQLGVSEPLCKMSICKCASSSSPFDLISSDSKKVCSRVASRVASPAASVEYNLFVMLEVTCVKRRSELGDFSSPRPFASLTKLTVALAQASAGQTVLWSRLSCGTSSLSVSAF